VAPSHPDWEVVCAFNAGVARMGGEVVLLLRVAERPRGLPAGPDAPAPVMLDLARPEPVVAPATTAAAPGLPDPATPPVELISVPLLDWTVSPPQLVVRYLRRDLPGLDLADPRLIKYSGRIYLTSVSHLRVARSRDGIHFEVERQPALLPGDPLEEFGVEDPRITELDGVYWINYTAVSRHGVATSLASTRDFRTFERHGMIFTVENRDVTIFPEKIGGRYAALHRPVPAGIGAPEIWLASSPDLVHWGDHRWVLGPRPGAWDSHRLGGGAVPIRTPRGWLAIYHGVDEHVRYCLGAVLLDLARPERVLARSPEPLLAPEADFEREGFFGNVVFSCGALVLEDGKTVRIYYGAADSVTAAADVGLDEILASLA
jgi:predicted GH43/DUF377 family glycosyl hydrolase